MKILQSFEQFMKYAIMDPEPSTLITSLINICLLKAWGTYFSSLQVKG